MFLWPSTTPGSVCTSTSRSAARCVSAKLRICVCANLMSSITPCGKARTHSAISLSESLNAGGDHLSNLSEYSRTAASPRAAIAERIASTVLRTCALFSALLSADWPDLRWRIMTLLLNQFVMFNRGRPIEKMVKQLPPFLVLRRRAKTNCMIFFRLPVYQQHVAVPGIDRPLQFVRDIALDRRKNPRGSGECRFKRRTVFRAYLQRGDFKNHPKDFTHRRVRRQVTSTVGFRVRLIRMRSTPPNL